MPRKVSRSIAAPTRVWDFFERLALERESSVSHEVRAVLLERVEGSKQPETLLERMGPSAGKKRPK